MSAGKAQIGKPAPDFTAKAVMPDGQFKDLKLSDYRGTVLPCYRAIPNNGYELRSPLILNDTFFFFFFPPLCREVRRFLLLPSGLHLRVSHRDRGLQRRGRGVQEDQLRGHRGVRGLALLPSGLVSVRVRVTAKDGA